MPGGGRELGEDAAGEMGLAAWRFAVDYPGHLVKVAGALAADVQFVPERLETATQFLVAACEEGLTRRGSVGGSGLKSDESQANFDSAFRDGMAASAIHYKGRLANSSRPWEAQPR